MNVAPVMGAFSQVCRSSNISVGILKYLLFKPKEMKQFYTIYLSITSLTAVNAQMILNEVYCSPGAGNHEFFELYNNSTNTTPTSVDGITIVSYFEEGTNQGFYVLDLPNLTVLSRGFFVGS